MSKWETVDVRAAYLLGKLEALADGIKAAADAEAPAVVSELAETLALETRKLWELLNGLGD